jgi:enoyl-CoA hydratase
VALTEYEATDGVATIAMDDGKVNALSAAMLGEVSEALAHAESDEAEVVVLTGARTTFSAGFDLRTEGEGWPEMLVAGARLAERIMSFPRPVVAACNGNALAMAGFLLLSTDYRVGVAGDFKIGLNEVRIGLTLPYFGIAIARHRLPRPYFDRCTVTGAILDPEEALAAGFLDELVAPEALADRARAAAEELKGVNQVAHAATKLRIRADAIAGIRDGIDRIEKNDREW